MKPTPGTPRSRASSTTWTPRFTQIAHGRPCSPPSRISSTRQPDQIAERHRRQPAADGADHRYRQQHHDGLQDQRPGHHAAEALPRVGRAARLRAAGRRRVGLLGHSGSRPNRVRAAPAVTTEPVITIPVPENASHPRPPRPPRPGRWRSRWRRAGSRRSSPGRARTARCAASASDSTSSARGDPLWVTTTVEHRLQRGEDAVDVLVGHHAEPPRPGIGSRTRRPASAPARPRRPDCARRR